MKRELTQTEETEIFRSMVAEINPEAIAFDGLDEAIVGIGERPDMPPVLVYDYGHIIEILMRDGPMDEEEAIEYYEFNIACLWAGEHTPVILSIPEIFVEDIH
jgi:hypothetical protein